MAHELLMVRAAFDNNTLRHTQKKTIQAWLDYYGKPLSIILTDTFGTKSFLEDFDYQLANNCIGVRQDSGDPINFGYAMINHYNYLGIDPKEKTIVFSDGLDVDLIIKLYKEFEGKINMIFGWGTDLTNNVGVKPLSIVIKATHVSNGYDDYDTVKLSDNICKATGPTSLIEKYISVFKPEQTKIETVY
jgi:nicotinate phosphoribosyltransferase